MDTSGKQYGSLGIYARAAVRLPIAPPWEMTMIRLMSCYTDGFGWDLKASRILWLFLSTVGLGWQITDPDGAIASN